MKPTSLLVYTSGAGFIQPGALLSGLRNGRPGDAAVTGYEKEPVASGNRPLLSSVLPAPHLGRAERDDFELYFSGGIELSRCLRNGGRCESGTGIDGGQEITKS